MELNQSDLPYFVSYVLLGEAGRPSSRRVQAQGFRGLWIGGQIRPKARVDDGALRRAVCIDAIHKVVGQSISKSAAELTIRLGMSSEIDVQRLRASYYEQRLTDYERSLFRGEFQRWRSWVLELPEKSLEAYLIQVSILCRPASVDLATLIQELRKDCDQWARNWECWRSRAETLERRLAETNRATAWERTAADYWALAEIRIRLGQTADSITLLEKALAIWTSNGHDHPGRKAQAVSTLVSMLSKLGERKTS